MNQINNEPNDIRSLSIEEIFKLSFELNSALKIVAISCVIGLVIGILFFATTPARYEATTIISLAQTIDPDEGSINIIPQKARSIQDRSLLIIKLNNENLTPEILSQCIDIEKTKSTHKVSDYFSITPFVETNYHIKIKYFNSNSLNSATICLKAFSDYLINIQKSVKETFISKLEKNLEINNNELKKINNNYYAKLDILRKENFSFLSNLEVMYKLENRLLFIKNSINFTKENDPKYFVEPVATKSPATNNRANKILGGLFGGALIGVLIIFCRMAIYVLKNTRKDT